MTLSEATRRITAVEGWENARITLNQEEHGGLNVAVIYQVAWPVCIPGKYMKPPAEDRAESP